MEPTETDFIVIRQGVPIVKGTSIPVLDVVNLWRHGCNMADIPAQLPDLSVAQVFACLRYYRDHEAEFPS